MCAERGPGQRLRGGSGAGGALAPGTAVSGAGAVDLWVTWCVRTSVPWGGDSRDLTQGLPPDS